MDRSSLIPVSVTCPCFGTPHADGDTVYLFPKLSLSAGIIAEQQISGLAVAPLQQPEIVAMLTETFLLHGVADWTFVDADGLPLAVNEDNKRGVLLADYSLARDLGDRADDLYGAAVIDPLAARLSNGSARPSTAGSTSPKKRSASRRRKPRKPSSTTISPMDGTTTTTS